MRTKKLTLFTLLLFGLGILAGTACAEEKKPNIILMMSDDTGWGDLGVYGGGDGRGHATPSLDRMAKEGIQFWSFYGQPSCTPGRAAAQTGRIPNRSGMTTVSGQGQGGGMSHDEWTIASVLKTVDYNTVFVGKWHLGEAAFSYPINHGYDEMYGVTLYHLNAFTYASEKWNPGMSAEVLAYFQKVTKGVLEGKANADGSIAQAKTVIEGKDVADNIYKLDQLAEDAAIAYIEKHARDDKPFFMSLNWSKNHQPGIPDTEFKGKSEVKTPYGDCVIEMDTRSGRILAKLRELDIDRNTLVVYTVDNGTWQDVYPDTGYTPFRGTKGTVREGGSRVPTIAWWPGTIPAGQDTHAIAGGLDFMATFAAVAGATLPTKDRAGKPMVFDSINQLPVMMGEKKSVRNRWLYFTEEELLPGAMRYEKFKVVWNLRGDNGQPTGGLAVDTNLGWKGPKKYVATAPQVFDLMQDPQERYDIFMNGWTEKTWVAFAVAGEVDKILANYKKYPPRPMQSFVIDMPYTINEFRKEHGLDKKK
jgi:arylsulfatase